MGLETHPYFERFLIGLTILIWCIERGNKLLLQDSKIQNNFSIWLNHLIKYCIPLSYISIRKENR